MAVPNYVQMSHTYELLNQSQNQANASKNQSSIMNIRVSYHTL